LVPFKRWGDDDLKRLSKDFMNKNPAHPPSLIDWTAERLDATAFAERQDEEGERLKTRNQKTDR
jgi:hypothetical protein